MKPFKCGSHFNIQDVPFIMNSKRVHIFLKQAFIFNGPYFSEMSYFSLQPEHQSAFSQH